MKPLYLIPMTALLGLGCAGTGTKEPASATQARKQAVVQQAKELELMLDSNQEAALGLSDLSTLRFVGMDDGPVPKFNVVTSEGKRLYSEDLVGEEPFVVVFFATWCEACGHKMPILQDALEKVGPITVILVSADEEDTWSHVPGYLKEFGMEFPVVSAHAYPRFALSYNPFETVPLVVVVGRNGGLVDYQIGLGSEDYDRFVKSIALARTIGPLANPGRLRYKAMDQADVDPSEGAKVRPKY